MTLEGARLFGECNRTIIDNRTGNKVKMNDDKSLIIYDHEIYDKLIDCIFETCVAKIDYDFDYFSCIIRADRLAAAIYYKHETGDRVGMFAASFENDTPPEVVMNLYDFIISNFAGVASPEAIAVIIRARMMYAEVYGEPEPPPDRYRL